MKSGYKMFGQLSVFGAINFEPVTQDNLITDVIKEKTQNITNIFDLFANDNKKEKEVTSPSIKHKQTSRIKNKNKSQYSLASINLPIISKDYPLQSGESSAPNSLKKKINFNTVSYNKTDCNSHKETKSNSNNRGIISLKKIGKKSTNNSPEKTRNTSYIETNVKANLVSSKNEIFKGVFQECVNGEKNLDKNMQEIEKLTFMKNQSKIDKILDKISFNQFGDGIKDILGSPFNNKTKKELFSTERLNRKLDSLNKISDNMSYKIVHSGRESSSNNEFGSENKKSLHSYVNKLINQSDRKKKDLLMKLDLRDSNIF